MHVFQKPFAGWGIDIRLPGHAKTDFADCRNKNDFCGRVQTENCPKSKCVTACPTRVERGEKRWWIFRPAFCFCYSLKRFVFGLVWNVSFGTPTCLALDSRALCERTLEFSVRRTSYPRFVHPLSRERPAVPCVPSLPASKR